MKRADWLVIVVAAVFAAGWCIPAARQLGATFDEPFYLDAGLDYWRHGHFGQLLAAGTMPLAAHLQTLPIYISEQLSGRLLTTGHDLGEMLRLARPVTLAFWVVLLVSVMRLGRHWGGEWGGRAAVVLAALEPNLLAHTTLATTDIAVAACFAAFVAAWLPNRDGRALRRVAVPAIWFGLAIAAKVSALALWPLAVAIVILDREMERRSGREVLRDAVMILVCGLAFAIAYCGTGGQPWLHNTLAHMPGDHWLRPLVAWVGAQPVFPNGLYAIWFQLAHNTMGQPVFIAGMTSTRALWMYLPLLLLIKLSIPTLVTFATAVVVTPSRRRAITVGITMLTATMLLFRVQTGIRFFLPLLVVAIAWTAAQMPRLFMRLSARWRAALLVIPVWALIASIQAWPDALRFVNEAWGGPSAGYRVVSDSNYDWGQGLPELAAWQRRDGRPVAIWYFGTDTRYPQFVRYDPRRDDDRLTEGRLLAVSTSLLYGGYLETPDRARALIERLRAATPIARTATFFIYSSAN